MSSNPKTMETPAEPESSDAVFYGIAVTLGVLCGLVSTMFLGYMRPSKPWRWVLLVGLFVPAVMSGANLMGYYRDLSRAGLYGSALIMLPGVAGAFGGHFGRRFMRVMFGK
jgi:hypothetical protein